MATRVVLMSKRGYKPQFRHVLYFKNIGDAFTYLRSVSYSVDFDTNKYSIEIIDKSRILSYKNYDSFIISSQSYQYCF